jgi:hypothetical protein
MWVLDQGGDPMIREGKHAVSRELTRILEFVDKVLVKEDEQLATGELGIFCGVTGHQCVLAMSI